MSLPDDTKPRSPFKDLPGTPVPASAGDDPGTGASSPVPTPRSTPRVVVPEHEPITPPDRYPAYPAEPPYADAGYSGANFIDPDQAATGPGCGVWAIIGGMALVLALAIVGLAAAAGWTSGIRVAQGNATATHQADVNLQLQQLEADINRGNTGLVRARLEFLATQTPGIPQVEGLRQTATALYLTSQPTATPTATATPEITATLAVTADTATTAPENTPTALPGGSLNLPALLADARTAVNEARYPDAIDLLDIIISADDQFESTVVDGLMSTALNQQALRLFRSGEAGLAEAIVLANRAEQFGPLADGVNFEREVAILYLNAKSRINTSDYSGSIRYLNDVLALAPNYLDTATLLVQQLRAYGDALLVSQPCLALEQYNAAAARGGSVDAAKRTTAENWCTNGTPTPEGFIATPDPNAQITPIGQP